MTVDLLTFCSKINHLKAYGKNIILIDNSFNYLSFLVVLAVILIELFEVLVWILRVC